MGSQTQRVLWIELVIEEVPHNEIVQVVLVRVVALIKDDQSNFLHFDEAMHQQVVELLSHCDEHIMFREFFTPSLQLGVVLGAALLSTEVASHHQVRVAFNRGRLLLNQVLDRHYEKYLFLLPRGLGET